MVYGFSVSGNTLVPPPYTGEPFTFSAFEGKLCSGDRMASGNAGKSRRQRDRTKAVLPVRVKGKDTAGNAFEELAHTLDVTVSGARLGSVRRELHVLDEVVVFYRQRKMQFRVMWTKKMKDSSEFQVGLQAVAQEKEVWGLALPEQANSAAPQMAISQASGLA